MAIKLALVPEIPAPCRFSMALELFAAATSVAAVGERLSLIFYSSPGRRDVVWRRSVATCPI